jgi:hypothetical protein
VRQHASFLVEDKLDIVRLSSKLLFLTDHAHAALPISTINILAPVSKNVNLEAITNKANKNTRTFQQLQQAKIKSRPLQKGIILDINQPYKNNALLREPKESQA